MLGEGDDDLNIRVIATYQSSDGLMELKVAMTGFMTEVMGRMVSSIPSLTSGATSVLETLSFCSADQGNAFLVPTPYYPGFDRDMRWWTGMKLILVHRCSCDDFTFSIKALDQALSMKKARSKGPWSTHFKIF
ncbi:probable aminotransferase ACS12 [Olea europaea subsp. europaea]|uniref:Probable aminotransferase ACS12 n=1 Tax=Olea europaea subsp. europaea TaxID=158383 RepID=A0A8S0QD36_OLEEU|nr:probable aminotransferase ACS12 [Olea europaea subsp. europaea]